MLIIRKTFQKIIKVKIGELKFESGFQLSNQDFLNEKETFLNKLKKKVKSYFYVTEEKFDQCAFKLFRNEFDDYLDFFFKNKENLTRIKLIKRDFEVYVKSGDSQEKQKTEESLNALFLAHKNQKDLQM